MQAVDRQPLRAADGAPVHPGRHRPRRTPLYRLVRRHVATFFAQAEDKADIDAVTQIQCLGSAASLNNRLHCLVLGGVKRCATDGAPGFVEVPAPTGEALQTVLHKIVARMMTLLTRRGALVEEERSA